MAKNSVLEFRKNLVSGEWVLVSARQGAKPIFFKVPKVIPLPKSKCPFKNLLSSRIENRLLWLPRPGKNDINNWWVQVLSNKYPVVESSKICPVVEYKDIFEQVAGVGFGLALRAM